MTAITTSNLCKTYSNGKEAVGGISLSIDAGGIFGFLGPNGAGKTTTVKLLTGMLAPSGGSARVLGEDPSVSPEKVHALSGVVTEHAQMYDNMTGRENLRFFGAVFGAGDSESEKRAAELLERFGLSEATDKKLGTYSTGMRQRLSLARAMTHRPKVLFLDEPTSGLDPESVKFVNGMIKDLSRNEGTTVFLCTHQLRYAEEICSSYGLADNGLLLASGTLAELRRMASDSLTLEIKADRMPEGIAYKSAGDGLFSVEVNAEGDIPAIAKRIVDSGANLYGLSARRMSLEEIYFSLLDKKGRREGIR